MDKKKIISEIQRTAEENNCIPLGKIRFLKATGIKESDWWGKYWAKWSDAVTEAGYEPNQKQGSYSEDYLYSIYLDYVLELGNL